MTSSTPGQGGAGLSPHTPGEPGHTTPNGDHEPGDPPTGEPGHTTPNGDHEPGDPPTGEPAIEPDHPKRDVVAIAAMAFGVIALVPLALVAGIIALARTRAGRRAGRPMAIAGIVLAGVWTLAGASVAAVVLTHPRHPVRHRRPLVGTVFWTHTGQCVNTAPNDISAAHVVPCSTPHDTEIYGTFQATGHRWPGTAAVREQASQGCASRLGNYLNPQFTAGLTESYVYPNRGAWLAGERKIVCEIHSVNGKLTGSVRGLGKFGK